MYVCAPVCKCVCVYASVCICACVRMYVHAHMWDSGVLVWWLSEITVFWWAKGSNFA